MPNRIIKESITTSATLAQLSAEEERFFIRLTVVVDDYGRIDGRPCILRAKCFGAMLERVTEKHVARWLEALIRVGLVVRYGTELRPYLFIQTWNTHQRIRAKASKCPEPLEADLARGHMTADDRGPRADDREPRTYVAVSEIRDPGSEIREARSESESRGFGEFWLLYPKKRHKPAAEKAWHALDPPEELRIAILAGLKRWMASDAWARGYIEDPATFVHQRQWEDPPALREPDGKQRHQEILAGLLAREQR